MIMSKIPFVENVRGLRAGVNVDECPQTRLIITQTEALPLKSQFGMKSSILTFECSCFARVEGMCAAVVHPLRPSAQVEGILSSAPSPVQDPLTRS